MFKIICKTENCLNKDITYYSPESTDPTMCGGCKTDIKPVKMTKTEFDKVFDYDPYQISEFNG
jgi:hypothetical protein